MVGCGEHRVARDDHLVRPPASHYRVVQTIPAHERAVAEAAPLLRRLDLQVAAADLPPLLDEQPTVATGPALLSSAQSEGDAQRAIDCMTAAVYYEARSEPVDGQRAVAQVVLNRVHDRAFPSSVCGVVYQGSNRSTGCQFSFACDGSLNRTRDDVSWARSREVAVAALSGQVDPAVGSATHYHTTAISPWWAPSLVRLGTIGHHIFYRWPDALERALGYRQSYAGIEPGATRAVAATEVAENGVTIHRTGGDTTEFGVAVHRGNPPADAAPIAIDATLIPASAAPAVVPRASPALVMDVRIHRGVDAPTGDASDPPTT